MTNDWEEASSHCNCEPVAASDRQPREAWSSGERCAARRRVTGPGVQSQGFGECGRELAGAISGRIGLCAGWVEWLNPLTYELSWVSSYPAVNRLKAFRAAATVAAISVSPCSVPRKAASNCEGGSQTPCSSMARWKRPKAAVSDCGLLVVGDRARSEEPCPHGADAVEGEGDAGLSSFCGDTFGDSFGSGFEFWVDFGGVVLQDS